MVYVKIGDFPENAALKKQKKVSSQKKAID